MVMIRSKGGGNEFEILIETGPVGSGGFFAEGAKILILISMAMVRRL